MNAENIRSTVRTYLRSGVENESVRQDGVGVMFLYESRGLWLAVVEVSRGGDRL